MALMKHFGLNIKYIVGKTTGAKHKFENVKRYDSSPYLRFIQPSLEPKTCRPIIAKDAPSTKTPVRLIKFLLYFVVLSIG